MDKRPPASIAFLLVPGFSAIAFFSALEPLRIANRLAGRALYRWTVHAVSGDHAEASNGMQIRADGPIDERAQTLIVCSGFDPLRLVGARLLAALRRAWRMGARLGAIDTGAFVLAEAGVLGHETITLHWEAAAEFSARYPQIPVSGELYERHARLFTCAGGTAAMDMMLEAIATTHGGDLASGVAAQLIHERIRPPSDPQRLGAPPAARPLLARALRLMAANLQTPLPVSAIARRLGASRKAIERAFEAELDCAPARHYRGLRLDHALALLEAGQVSLHDAALAAGFSSQPVFSRACKQHFGQSPRARLDARLAALARGGAHPS